MHAIVRRFWQPRGPPSLLWQARRNLPGLHHLDKRHIGSPTATVSGATPAAVRRLGRPELLQRTRGDARAQDPELQARAVRGPLPVELREVLLVAAESAIGSPTAAVAGATPAAVRRLGRPELLQRTRTLRRGHSLPLVLLCTTRAEKVFVLHFIPSPLISIHGVCLVC